MDSKFSVKDINFEFFKSGYRREKNNTIVWILDDIAFLNSKEYEKTIKLINDFENHSRTNRWVTEKYLDRREFTIQHCINC